MESLPVIITLRSHQALDGETSRLEEQAEGTLAAAAEGWQLRYRESGGETHLALREGEALLERGGAMALCLRFRPGRISSGRCKTPCGDLELSVETEYLRHALTPEGGRVMLRYRLSAQWQSMGHFALQLHVRPAQTAAAEPQEKK